MLFGALKVIVWSFPNTRTLGVVASFTTLIHVFLSIQVNCRFPDIRLNSPSFSTIDQFSSIIFNQPLRQLRTNRSTCVTARSPENKTVTKVRILIKIPELAVLIRKPS